MEPMYILVLIYYVYTYICIHTWIVFRSYILPPISCLLGLKTLDPAPQPWMTGDRGGRMMGSLPCGHAIGRASCSEQLSGHQARRKGQAERCTLQPCWLVVCASTGAFGVSYVVEVSERGKRRREGGCLGGRLPRANEAWGCCLRMARHRWWEQTRASHERVGQAARQSGNPAVR